MSLPKECPVGPQRKRRKTLKKNLEGTVVRECLHFLRLYPDVIYVERRNTGAVKFQDGGFIRFGSRGAGDIWCLVRAYAGYAIAGRPMSTLMHVEIEAKRRDGKGRQSADQKEFQAFCDGVGIPYLLVTSATELAEKLSKILLDR